MNNDRHYDKLPIQKTEPSSPVKSWKDLKWNNPENKNRTSPFKSNKRNIKTCKKCGRSYKNSVCFTCQKIGNLSKMYPQTKPSTSNIKAMDEVLEETATSTSTTPSPSFYNDRRLQKEHWWRCDGPCQYKMPFFGMVRRAINRAPGPCDRWWAYHSSTCGGTFIKVKEPGNINQTQKNADIRSFLSSSKIEDSSTSSSSPNSTPSDTNKETKDLKPSTDLIHCSLCQKKVESSNFEDHENECLMKICDNVEEQIGDQQQAPCVACGKQILLNELNSHLDNCMNEIFQVDFDDSKEDNAEFNCPLCMTLVTEKMMKEHIDGCLSTTNNNDLIDSFFN